MKHLKWRPARVHLTYANVVSTICLFILVGGGAAYGAAKVALPKNSVGTRQIKKGAIATPKIKANAVNSAKVADGSLTGNDVAEGSLTGADIADGSVAGADVADGSLGTADLADAAVNSAKVADRSLKGTDVAPDSLTGTEIDESTLGQVPSAANAALLDGKAPSAFTSSTVYVKQSPLSEGTNLGDGTFAIEESCNPGDLLVAGGPAEVNATSTMVESFPAPGKLNGWKARIKPAAADNFVVVLLCARQ